MEHLVLLLTIGFNPNFDIDNDATIGVFDAAIISAYWTGPLESLLDL